MDEKNTIKIIAYHPDTSCNQETGETIDVYTLAKSLTIENFAAMLDDFLNLGGKGYREGKQVGLQLRFTHRTLQRLVICFALGMIATFLVLRRRKMIFAYTQPESEPKRSKLAVVGGWVRRPWRRKVRRTERYEPADWEHGETVIRRESRVEERPIR
jgi:hypothetical protein